MPNAEVADYIIATEQFLRRVLETTEHIEIDFFILMLKTWLILCQPWKASALMKLYQTDSRHHCSAK